MGSSSEQKHECRVCGAVFSSAEQLSDHSDTHSAKTDYTSESIAKENNNHSTKNKEAKLRTTSDKEC
jgi:hypothetical protein